MSATKENSVRIAIGSLSGRFTKVDIIRVVGECFSENKLTNTIKKMQRGGEIETVCRAGGAHSYAIYEKTAKFKDGVEIKSPLVIGLQASKRLHDAWAHP